MMHKEVRTRAYRFIGEHPAFPAQWVDGLSRALPGERLFCHRHSKEALASRELDASPAASGPHDCAVRDMPRSSVVAVASTASHRTFVTISSRPSSRRETGGNMQLICPTC